MMFLFLKIKKSLQISQIPEELDYIKDLLRNQILSIEQITNRSFSNANSRRGVE